MPVVKCGWLLWLSFYVLQAQESVARHSPVKQGQVLWVESRQAQQARLNGRIIHLFSQPNGRALGLMPIPVLQKPGQYTLELLHSNSVIHSEAITVLDARYPRQNIAIQQSVATLKPSPGEQSTVGEFRKEVDPARYWTDTLQLPIPGCLTSPFGVQRYYNGKPTGDFHAGLDQRGASGTPIHAVAAGIVGIVEQFNLRGGTVAIDHGQGLQSIYMHMSKLGTSKGAHVAAGEVIGYVGSTGRATGPHLHWTLYAQGEPIDPSQWLTLPPPCAAAKPTLKKPHSAVARSAPRES